MIKVNLYVGKEPFKMPVILGVDLAKISFKGIALAWLLTFVPDFVFKDTWETDLNNADVENVKLQKQLSVAKRELKKFNEIEDEIDKLVKKEKKLADKLVLVKRILKTKKNPMQIMLYMAKNIPEDLWLESFSIRENVIEIKGKSKTYKSIGVFVENLRNSIFFEKDINIIKSQTETDTDTNMRKEIFEIKGTVKSFT